MDCSAQWDNDMMMNEIILLCSTIRGIRAHPGPFFADEEVGIKRALAGVSLIDRKPS